MDRARIKFSIRMQVLSSKSFPVQKLRNMQFILNPTNTQPNRLSCFILNQMPYNSEDSKEPKNSVEWNF
jgi:hypothetical protein